MTAKILVNRVYIRDSLDLCDMAWPITYYFNIPNYVGYPSLEAKLFFAVTGIVEEEIDRCVERIFNLQRTILVREGQQIS